MILKLKSYNDFTKVGMPDTYICIDEEGYEHKVDIHVDGGLGKAGEDRKSLVGRKIQVEYLTPYLEIANNVKLLESI